MRKLATWVLLALTAFLLTVPMQATGAWATEHTTSRSAVTATTPGDAEVRPRSCDRDHHSADEPLVLALRGRGHHAQTLNPLHERPVPTAVVSRLDEAATLRTPHAAPPVVDGDHVSAPAEDHLQTFRC